MDKKKIVATCDAILHEKLEAIQGTINDYKKDLSSETKSSAGDKHETGRAMLQLEMEKLGQQYLKVLNQKNRFHGLDISLKDRIQQGSFIQLEASYFFIAESLGFINVDHKKVMVLSIHAPLAQLMIGKKLHDEVCFRGKMLKINQVL